MHPLMKVAAKIDAPTSPFILDDLLAIAERLRLVTPLYYIDLHPLDWAMLRYLIRQHHRRYRGEFRDAGDPDQHTGITLVKNEMMPEDVAALRDGRAQLIATLHLTPHARRGKLWVNKK